MILQRKLLKIKKYGKLSMSVNLFFCLLPIALHDLEIILTAGVRAEVGIRVKFYTK